MIEFVLIGTMVGAVIFLFKGQLAEAAGMDGDATESHVIRSNKWNAPDIDATLQNGDYDTTYDDSFEKASARTGVPFALIKAHAIRESSLKPNAYHYDDAANGASYGLLQVEWMKSGKNYNRLAQFGYSGDTIKDGSILYNADVSAFLGASIMAQNLTRFNSNIRDAINAYNTGVAEATRAAPGNYVDDVISYYEEILGESIS